MLKLIKFVKVKIILLFIFTFTVILGLWTAGFFEQYKLNFGVTKTFSQTETENLGGKRIYDRCVEKDRQKPKVGWTIFYSYKKFGDANLWVKWNDEKYQTGYPKVYFEQCMEVEK